MTITRRCRLLAPLTAIGLLVAACSGDDTAADTPPAPSPTATSATDETTPGVEVVDPPEVEWESCGEAECATVAVPLDHERPDGPEVEIFVRRLPAMGERIGALFFNFGGPGAGASELIGAFPIPAEVRDRFDIVGMDPRGVGRSTPLDCGLDPTTLYSVDHTVEDAIDAQTLIDVSERYADDCARESGQLLAHLGTRDVARDMDLIRSGMGDEQLSYVGYSYGTAIGQVYAELFPERVRAMVLDGLVDPEPSGIELATEQAQGFETALANWADGCSARSTCRFADPIQAVEQVLARAEEGINSSDGVRALGPGEAAIGLAYPLYQQGLWSALDRAIADAIDRDGRALVALADAYTRLVDFSVYYAVSCLDTSWPRDTEEFLEAAEEAGRVAPHFGEAVVNDYLRCAVWPEEPQPIGPVVATDAPAVLVVSTTGDPATPYENGVVVADRLASGVLLSYEGEGHTVVFQRQSSCVDDIVSDYLLELTVPPDGTTC